MAIYGFLAVEDTLRGQLIKAFVVLVNGVESSEALAKEIRQSVKSRPVVTRIPTTDRVY